MAKLSLTRGQIIEAGLDLAARPDLVTQARLWLNLFLEGVYMDQDFDWLVKTLDSQSLVDGMDIPEDYRGAKSAVLITEYGGQRPIEIINDAAEYDARRNESSSSAPQKIYVDADQKKFFLIPGPATGYLLDLKYYYIPELPDIYNSEDVGDFAVEDTDLIVPKWELPVHILIDAIKSLAKEYNDSADMDAAMNKVMAKIAASKMNNRDSRAGTSRLKFGKSFRKRFY